MRSLACLKCTRRAVLGLYYRISNRQHTLECTCLLARIAGDILRDPCFQSALRVGCRKELERKNPSSRGDGRPGGRVSYVTLVEMSHHPNVPDKVVQTPFNNSDFNGSER
jgi:hypothetical protein